jgi:hypothetical protein
VSSLTTADPLANKKSDLFQPEPPRLGQGGGSSDPRESLAIMLLRRQNVSSDDWTASVHFLHPRYLTAKGRARLIGSSAYPLQNT